MKVLSLFLTLFTPTAFAECDWSYKYTISVTANKIQLSVELAINEAFIPAENYGGLKSFFELLIAKENEKVVLSKT
jgi:hypothetical protein